MASKGFFLPTFLSKSPNRSQPTQPEADTSKTTPDPENNPKQPVVEPTPGKLGKPKGFFNKKHSTSETIEKDSSATPEQQIRVNQSSRKRKAVR